MADTGEILVMPKAAIQTPDGQLTPTGRKLIGSLVDRVSVPPAGSAEEFLVGGKAMIRSQALFGATKAIPTSGGGSWQPDLGSRLHFKRTVSGPLTILFPANIPDEDSEPFFSVWLTMDSVGGWTVDFGPGFEGQAPTVLASPGDRTLLGFNITGEGTFTGWSVKGIQAGT
jgi:hypothetical protein